MFQLPPEERTEFFSDYGDDCGFEGTCFINIETTSAR
jgi:hypothetical protein